MANPEHVEILRQGVKVWNKWREENPYVRPDLRYMDFSSNELIGVNLSKGDFFEANFYGCYFSKSDFKKATLNHANLIKTDLSQTDFTGADLIRANCHFANLRGANLSSTNLGDVNLDRADLNDQSFAERLYNDLQCWFATEDLRIGDKFWHRIDESIRLYDKLLVVLSENSVTSS